jgi:protease-4
MYRPYTDDERLELGRKVKMMYDTFVDRVARGRGMTADQVDAVGRGHVWTGEQALQNHLVDRLGGLREALDEAKKRGGLGRDAPIVELPIMPADLFSTLLRLGGLGMASATGEDGDGPIVEQTLPLPRDLVNTGRSLLPFMLFDGATPMMHLEGVTEPP